MPPTASLRTATSARGYAPRSQSSKRAANAHAAQSFPAARPRTGGARRTRARTALHSTCSALSMCPAAIEPPRTTTRSVAFAAAARAVTRRQRERSAG